MVTSGGSFEPPGLKVKLPPGLQLLYVHNYLMWFVVSSGKKIVVHMRVTQAANHNLLYKVVVKTYVELVVIIGNVGLFYIFIV